jgi:hypothetical protein
MKLLPLLVLSAASGLSQSSLDYEFFKTKVEPIFLAKREGHARCYVCHSTGTAFRLQRLSPGARAWNEEQSRKNFLAVQYLIDPAKPEESRLLLHPLSEEAGGDGFHSGGKHFHSRDDAEWQTLLKFVTVTAKPR